MLSIYLLVTVALGALAAPPHQSLDLALVVNSTMCPTVIDYDEDDTRVPRIIKIIKCEEKPDEVCAKTRNEKECCERQFSDQTKATCVEVTDTVLVSTADLSEQYTIRVPVGCTCVIQHPVVAKDVSSGPSTILPH